MLAITAFVLAIAVPSVVAIALLTYVRSELSRAATLTSSNYSQTIAQLTTSFAQLSERVNKCETAIAQTTSTHLAGEVAAVAADLESLAKSCRKQFGKLFAEAHHDGALRRNRESQSDFVDDELEAVLALQRADPARPNGAAGG